MTRLLSLFAVAFACLACTDDGDHARLYHSQPKAPSFDAAKIEALEHLGPTIVDKGVNFGVYSERATRIELLLFDDPESTRPTKRFELHRFGDVWNVHVEGIGLGQHYGYVAWGPNWTYDPDWVPGTTHGFVADVDVNGNRFNPNKLLIDPYAKAIHRDHDWSKGSLATGPARGVSTWAAASKSVVTRSEYKWSEHEAQWVKKRKAGDFKDHAWHDQIIYEVHLKGFTKDPAAAQVLKMIDPERDVKHPGTYRGMGEMAPYLKDLGITAVEFLPIHEKPLDGGYWGYQTINFFAPEISYASRQVAPETIDEFKWMVDQLHQHGIEVILDVVYNHTGEGGFWRQKLELNDHSLDPNTDGKLANFDPHEVVGLYSFRGLDNHAYYALQPNDLRQYWNDTGVGNQCRCNHRPFRKLILDSLRYWVEEMHVDGFRFDLAPVMGDKDGVYGDWPADPGQPGGERTVLHEIIDDPVMNEWNVRIIAEPWAAGGWNPYKVGRFPRSSDRPNVGWYEWNGRFRDWWRSFVNEDWVLNQKEGGTDFGSSLTGSHELFDWNGRRPYHSINFVTVHDGFTMYDLMSYATKQNKCGPLNPVCCDEPFSAWCDKDSGENHNRSRDYGSHEEGEATKRQMMRNLFVAMLVSHGTPMLYGGDEWMRTQLGNNNAYSTQADNEYNWFQWGNWIAKNENHRMRDFVRQMIRFRKSHIYAFAPTEYGGSAPFAWKSAGNGDEPDWGARHMMVHYYDGSKGPELALLFNMESGPVEFTLPEGRTWQRVVDTQSWFDRATYLTEENKDLRRSWNATVDDPVPVQGGSYGVPAKTIVILEAAP